MNTDLLKNKQYDNNGKKKYKTDLSGSERNSAKTQDYIQSYNYCEATKEKKMSRIS